MPSGPNTESGLGTKRHDPPRREDVVQVGDVVAVEVGQEQRPERPGPRPTAAARIKTPRPQSKSKSPAVVRTSVDGPARAGSGSGLPLPKNDHLHGAPHAEISERIDRSWLHREVSGQELQ